MSKHKDQRFTHAHLFLMRSLTPLHLQSLEGLRGRGSEQNSLQTQTNI